MKILNFGSCNIDYVYTVEHIVHAGETIPASQMELFPGGKGLNQSIALARSGANVYHAGYIGNDGVMLRDILHDSGVDVSFLKSVNAKNGHAIIQVDASGENSIFVYKGTNGLISTDFIDTVLNSFSAGDILLLQNEIHNIFYLIETAHKKKMQIVFNPSPFTKALTQVNLHHISYLILNETEAKGFSGKDNPKESISYFREKYPALRLVLTLGKKGCIYADHAQMLAHPAFAVKPVDTTAAGDTFTGYFVSQVAAGSSHANAIHIASAASAITVSKMGAAPSIPKLYEVENALDVLKPCGAESIKDQQRTEIYRYIEKNLKGACQNAERREY